MTESRTGWTVVVVGFVALALSFAYRNLLQLTMTGMEADLGWSRSLLSSGATLKAVAKWALIVMTGTGGIGTAASVVSAQATMAEQVKALQAEVAEVKEKTQDTAEAVARIEGYLSPKRLAPQKKGR